MGYTIDSLVEEARSELLIPLPGAAFAKSRGSLKKVSEHANSNLRELLRHPALFTPRRRRCKASPRQRRVPEPSIPTVRVAVRGSRDQVIGGPFISYWNRGPGYPWCSDLVRVSSGKACAFGAREGSAGGFGSSFERMSLKVRTCGDDG